MNKDAQYGTSRRGIERENCGKLILKNIASILGDEEGRHQIYEAQRITINKTKNIH